MHNSMLAEYRDIERRIEEEQTRLKSLLEDEILKKRTRI
ncbi:hypothetical protein SAMN05216589_0282 [Halopseudomonas bauzanensis]|uniref:Uncharacterized protein n=1 Tax=Halopseudomonas bauzanensis TaxID=653930 RepID=A0A1H9NH06_9GAMM|nr:hypothetical protein SAMN05216589_0282 [Halopseudomonas bauzanensis]